MNETTSFPPVTLTVTLTNEELVSLWNALEYKMKDLDHAAEWAAKNGYDKESYYRDEFAKLSVIKKKFK
jgi:hypothetical protein